MKSRFWFFTLLLLIGTMLASYSAGRYEGARSTHNETQQFLKEFARAIDLEAYLQQRGHKEWTTRLLLFGMGEARSSFHSSSYPILVGLGCVAVGIIGLLPCSR